MPVVVVHAPPTNTSTTAAKSAGGITGAIAHTSVPPWYVLLPLVLVLAVAIIAIIIYMYRSASRKFSYVAALFDPRTRRWSLYRVARVATNIYSTIDGKVIMIGSPNGEVEDFNGNRWPALVGVDVGGINMTDDMYKNIIVAMLGEEYSTKTPAEIITMLYERGEIPATIKIRPDLQIGITVDAESLAKQLSYEKARRESETMIAIAAMGYNRKEFEEVVRHMIEKELTQAKGFSIKILALAIGLMLILAIIINAVK